MIQEHQKCQVMKKRKKTSRMFFSIFIWQTLLQGIVGGSSPPEDPFPVPTIIEHPSDTTVIEDEPVTLNCKAAFVQLEPQHYNYFSAGSKNEPKISIQWFQNGKLVRTGTSVGPQQPPKSKVTLTGSASSQHRILLPDGSLFFLRAVRGEDDGTYYCVAFANNNNKAASVVKSQNATLRVAYLEDEFEGVPNDVQAVLGSQLELKCDPPAGFPYPVIRWKKDGQFLDLTSSQRIVILSNGHLKIMELLIQDSGSYQCTAANMAGTRETKPSARIQVLRPPFFIRMPDPNTTVVAGEDILLDCIGDGDPTPKTKWTRIGPGFPPEGLLLDLPSYKVVAGKGLRLTHVHPSQAGLYSCSLTSSIGSVSSVTQLDVHEAPVITVRPRSELTVMFGDTVTLECLATGSPTPALLWMHEKDRTVLLPGDRTDSGLEVTERGFLKITGVKSSSTYVCMAVNVVGAAMARSYLIVESAGKKIYLGPRTYDEHSNAPSIQALQVHGISSTSIKVSWRLATPSTLPHHIRHLETEEVDGFYILYRPSVGRPPGFTSITVLHAAATSYVVNRLEPYTPYEFLVVPFYRGLSGQPSALYKALTLEARPVEAPTQLAWYQVNASSVDILWKPISLESFRGKPVGYQVMILQEGGRVAANRSIQVSPTETAPHMLMSNLEPRHTYFIQVAAFTSRGIGPFSDVLKVRPEPSLALSGASQVAITDIDEYMGRHSAESNTGSAWLVPLLVVGLVVFVSALATAALVYVHRKRVKSAGSQVGHHTSTPASNHPTSATRRPCMLHLPAALITLTTQSPKFKIKLRRNGNSRSGNNRKSNCTEGDFQLLATPMSSSSTRCSFPATAADETAATSGSVSRNNTYCSLKRFGGRLDEGEAAFLEVRHRAEGHGASSAETMWIDRGFDNEKSQKDNSKKKKHFIYSTMSRITMCSGIKDKPSEKDLTKKEKRLKLRSGILLSERKSNKKSRRGESEEESDYAYIDRSTHSITGYLNMEAKNQTRGVADHTHSLSTFTSGQLPTQSCPLMSDIANADEDPLAPYATSQVLLTHQHLADHMNQQMVTTFQDGCRLSTAGGNMIQPLNVNTFLCPETGNITDASDHLYAVVAATTTNRATAKFRPHSIVTFSRDASGASSSLSRHSSLSILDQVVVRPPNLLDLIPPPPMEEPPVCLDMNPSSPLWYRRPGTTGTPMCNLGCCNSGGGCCHPLMQTQVMDPNCRLFEDIHHPQCLDNCNAAVELKTNTKPRVRKLSSPSKRSLTRQRNKAKVAVIQGNSEFVGVAPPPLSSTHQYLLTQEKCLSDNDGDDEGETLHLLVTAAHDGSRVAQNNNNNNNNNGLSSFSSMPRQGRRKKSKKVEEHHPTTTTKKKENNWLLMQPQQQQQQQQQQMMRASESEPLLESPLTPAAAAAGGTGTGVAPPSNQASRLVSFSSALNGCHRQNGIEKEEEGEAKRRSFLSSTSGRRRSGGGDEDDALTNQDLKK